MPPLTWWRGIEARKTLENYFTARVAETRGSEGTDMLSVLCQAEDEDGERFSDDDIVSHMIFLMMAAHDTSTSTMTTMAYHLAANPGVAGPLPRRVGRIGDGPLDIEALEKLETYDLVINEVAADGHSAADELPPGRARHRTARLLHPGGHQRDDLAGAQPPAARAVDRPEKFDPDRFAEPRNEHKKHRYAFAPFGGGAHKCIGMVFGQLEIKTVMHRLLRKYRLELAHPGYKPRYDYGGMPVPMDGMPIVLAPAALTRSREQTQKSPNYGVSRTFCVCSRRFRSAGDWRKR